MLTKCGLLIAVTLACGGCANSIEQTVPPLHVADFSARPTIGVLGKYLGQREVIEGTKVEHSMLVNGIAVTTVNGQPLPQPVRIDLHDAERLLPGVTYKLEGYESGTFNGIPQWFQPGAQQYFGYIPFFVVTRQIQPTPPH